MTSFTIWLACGVLDRVKGSTRCMGSCAILACMLVLGFWCFLLLLLGMRLRSSASFFDNIDSFGSNAHNIEIVCYGYVSPTCCKHLGCCGLAAVALRSRVSNVLTSLLSVRAWTRWNWMFHSFSLPIWKLHIMARALRQSTSSSGVSPGLICTSSNWYIWHLWDTVQSIWDAKWSRKDFAPFLVAATSSMVMLAGVLWFHFWQAVVLRKFRMYSKQAPLSYVSSGIAWRQHQLSVDSQNSLNSSYWSDVVHSKMDVFKLVAGWFGISDLRAAVRTVRGSAVVPAGSLGWAMTAMLQWKTQTWYLDRSFPEGQWRIQTALVPKITTRGHHQHHVMMGAPPVLLWSIPSDG